MNKYILLLIVIFITGCTNKEEMDLNETSFNSKNTVKKQEKIIDTFSKRLNLNFMKKENKESLFSLGYGHFKKD